MLTAAFASAPRTVRHGGRSAALGLTLIELLVTFVLLGILTRLAMPSFATWIANAQVRTVAEALQNGIRLAQSEAVRRNRQVVLTFTAGTPRLNAPASAGGRNWSLQTVQQFGGNDAEYLQGGELSDIASGISIASTGAVVNALCFNSSGRLVVNPSPGPAGSACTAAGATFEVNRNNADRRLWIVVGLAGQMRMCDPGRPTVSADSPDGCE